MESRKLKQRLLILSLNACLSTFSFAQVPELKWGKIDQGDLKMTIYEKDTAANAVVLVDKGEVNFSYIGNDFVHNLNRHRRVKILKKSGVDQADIRIVYYSYGNYQVLSGLKAQVIQPDGSKVEVNKKDIFEEKISDGKYTKTTFSFPQVKEGSVLEYAYMLRSQGVFSLDTWYFQEDIPVITSSYSVKVPEFLEYVYLNTGKTPQHQNQELTNISLEPGSTINATRVDLVASHMPGLKKEAFITTMDDYLSSVKMQLSGQQTRTEGMRPVLSDWVKVANELMENENFGVYLKKRSSVDNILDAIKLKVSENSTPEEKMQVAFMTVLEKLDHDGSRGIFPENSPKKVWENGTGSVADINMTLTAVLKHLGFDANPMLVSTQDHGNIFTLYPIISQFNYLLCNVRLNDKTWLLDATSKYNPMGYPATDALNKQGWVVREGNPEWFTIIPEKGSLVRLFNFTLDKEDHVSGELKASYSGYAAADLREEMFEEKEAENEQDDEDVTAQVATLEFSDVQTTDEKNIQKPVTYKAKVHLKDGVMVNGEMVYIPAVVQPSFSENPFTQPTRNYPVDIAHPISRKYIMNLEIPEGYIIDQLPESVRLALPDNGGSFTFQTQKNAPNKAQISSTIAIDQLHFEVAEYAIIKKFFDLIIEKQQEQIVIKKTP